MLSLGCERFIRIVAVITSAGAMIAHIDPTSRGEPRSRCGGMIGNAQRAVVTLQEFKNGPNIPARVTELEAVAPSRIEHGNKRAEPVDIRFHLWGQLEQNRPE